MTVNPKPWVQIAITAGIVFVVAVLPGLANAASDGFSSADVNAANIAVGTGVAAALRAIVAAVNLSGNKTSS